MKNNIAAFIPARGGSKSIPLKNIKHIAGKPLIYWVLEAVVNSKCIDTVFVSTDSIDIKDCVELLNNPKITVIERSKETAIDTASSESALLEFCNNYDFNYVFFIQATSPLLISKDIDNAWEEYKRHKYDSLLSVVKQKRFVWDKTKSTALPVNYDPLKRPRRQDFDGYYVENGAFYLSSRNNILNSACRISGNVGLYSMSAETYYELDEEYDWEIIENILLTKKSHKNNNIMKNIKLFVMDCDGILTDSGMYYSKSGEELKKFNTKDGMGIELLHNAGIKTAIITGEKTKIVERRSSKLKINYLYQDVNDKLEIIKDICKKENIKLQEIAYIGDDINDIEALKNIGLSFCPRDANIKIKNIPGINILQNRGGNAVVREAIDLILDNRIK